jgi:hypothetical protein
MRVFDWDTAARRIVAEQPDNAGAGLQDDWEWTGGDIYRDGEIVPQEDTYTYLMSTWAVPELALDGIPGSCWVWADESEWDESTYWPDTARAILKGDK